MVNVEFLKQIVESIDLAVAKLEDAVEKKDKDNISKLKVFIFDLHRKFDSAIDEELRKLKVKNV